MRALFLAILISLSSTYTLASDCDDLTRKAAFQSDQMTDQDRKALMECANESDSDVDGYGFASPDDLQQSIDMKEPIVAEQTLEAANDINRTIKKFSKIVLPTL